MQSPAVSLTSMFNCYCSYIITCRVPVFTFRCMMHLTFTPFRIYVVWVYWNNYSISGFQISVFTESSPTSSWLGAVCLWNSDWHLEWTKP
jgi:hypothetical protein